jgi:HlyD family secretion protein
MPDTPTPARYRWKFIAAVLATLLAAVLALRWWSGPQVVAQTLQRRDLVQSVVASGRVETAHRVEIGAQITATVVRVPVSEGQVVKAGDVLIELESAEQRAIARQAQIALTQTQTRLRQLSEVQTPVAEQALRQAQASFDNASSMLRRQQELFGKGFIGEAALDDSRQAFELADAQRQSANKQLATLRAGGGEHEFTVASVAQARAAAEAAHARAGYALIRAPLAGTLIGRSVEVGDVVQAGKVLMTLSPAGPTQLVAEIDERNLRLLALGQPALASADAYPQQRFGAKLVYINPAINAQTGAVQVKLDVAALPLALTQDMTVSIDIDVAHRQGALLLPVGALSESAGPEAVDGSVLRIEGGRAMRRPVRLGLRSGGWAEVLEGLSVGDRVVAAPATVAPGSRVRAVAPAALP